MESGCWNLLSNQAEIIASMQAVFLVLCSLNLGGLSQALTGRPRIIGSQSKKQSGAKPRNVIDAGAMYLGCAKDNEIHTFTTSTYYISYKLSNY
jgi:hypothetical protein